MKKIDQLVCELSDARGNPTLVLSSKKLERLLPFDVVKAFDGTRVDELDVVFLSCGGSIEGAYNVIRVLRSHAKKVNVLVPFYAKSAGTLVCLAADSLVLSTLSELGPLDAQVYEKKERKMKSALNTYNGGERVRREVVGHFEAALAKVNSVDHAIAYAGKVAAELYRAIDHKKIVEDERQLMIGVRYAERVLTEMMGWEPAKASVLARRLVFDYPSHDYVIDREEVRSLGLPVENASEAVEQVLHKLAIELHDEDEPIVCMRHMLKLLPVTVNAKTRG